jgi:NAD(P)-dependent dehydrogenase (short-subunit alcohol dehydrogenase family)
MTATSSLFDLTGRVAFITGGAGLLGRQHAEVLASAGATAVLVDLPAADPAGRAAELALACGGRVVGYGGDLTRAGDVDRLVALVEAEVGPIDILINNAANNPKMEAAAGSDWTRFENFPLAVWDADLAVGITGAFLCCQRIGPGMAARGRGVILNVASDLAVIAPDQRLYRREGEAEDRQPVKPVTYSVVKTALVGLTRYLATYWADRNVRVNAICPGGVRNGQPQDFVDRLQGLIPLGRMARVDEYQGSILFLCSDASSYMTGTSLVVDGGRSCW